MKKRRKRAESPAEQPQPDAGYEQSHGYGPSHGGPTGPGDAPATGVESATPPPDDEVNEDEA